MTAQEWMSEMADAAGFDALQGQDPVYALACDGQSWFAARASGLYHSDDLGQTWNACYDQFKPGEALTTTCVTLSPDFARDHLVFAGVKGGILRSFDGGETWLASFLPNPPPLIIRILISPDFERDGIVLAATAEDGVYVSTDRGRTWAGCNFGLLDLRVTALAMSPAFSENETAFVSTETGVFRSTNGGRAWREIPFPDDAGLVLALTLAPDYPQSHALFAGTESGRLLRSADRGSTWERLSLDAGSPIVDLYFFDSTLAVLAEDGIYTSNDMERWTAILSNAPATLTAFTPLEGDARQLLAGLADGSILRP